MVKKAFLIFWLLILVAVPLWAENDTKPLEMADLVEQVSPAVTIVKSETITRTFKPGQLIVRHNWRMGSGFIINSSGYVLTCDHIVGAAEKIEVELKDGTKHEASIVKRDSKADLALLQIKACGLPLAVIGSPDKTRTGDFVFTIGNPLPKQINTPSEAFKHSVVTGIISSTERLSSQGLKIFQLSMSVNYGNSGGPLLNRQGAVIGIVNSKMLAFNGHGIEGVGFALSIQEASKMLKMAQAQAFKQEIALKQEIAAKQKNVFPAIEISQAKRWWLAADLLVGSFLLAGVIIVRRKRLNKPHQIALAMDGLLNAVEQNKRMEFSRLLSEVLPKMDDAWLIDSWLKQNRQLRQNEWVLIELKKQLPPQIAARVGQYLYKLKKLRRGAGGKGSG